MYIHYLMKRKKKQKFKRNNFYSNDYSIFSDTIKISPKDKPAGNSCIQKLR